MARSRRGMAEELKIISPTGMEFGGTPHLKYHSAYPNCTGWHRLEWEAVPQFFWGGEESPSLGGGYFQ